MFCQNTGTKFREPFHLNHVIPRLGLVHMLLFLKQLIWYLAVLLSEWYPLKKIFKENSQWSEFKRPHLDIEKIKVVHLPN